MSAFRLVGKLPPVIFGTAGALFRMDLRELGRGLKIFGYGALVLSLFIGVLAGALVIVQTGLYIKQFGARAFVGWASGYGLLHEFGPLLLGLVLASRLGARNAAELATLTIGGQIEGLRGVALDPVRLLVAPRVVAITLSVTLLASTMFLAGVLAEAFTALWLIDLPLRVFFASFAHPLAAGDVFVGIAKCAFFGAAIAVISTASGLEAKGGARAVGEAAASAVVASCAAIFALDFALTSIFIRVMQ